MATMNDEVGVIKRRINSIDILRGIIMVVMALDHTRDYFHSEAFVFDPTNLSKTTLVLFLTRWVTHFCMPAFILLAGVGIRIRRQRTTPKELSTFLLTRGLWMVVLEFGVMRFGYFFNFYFDATILSVLWTFGLCFIILSMIVSLPDKFLLVLGLIITLFHDLSGLVVFNTPGPLSAVWMIFMRTGFLPISPDFALIVSYPIIPWLGVMLIGYYLGSLYDQSFGDEKRRQLLFRIGVITIITFVALRLANFYGDPSPWSVQKDWILTVMSFFNTTKYPVSLLFILMTIGPLLIILAGLEKWNTRWIMPVIHFGRVPLFYFIIHFYLIHASALLLFVQKTGKSFAEIDLHFEKSFGGITAEGGYSLPWVYVAWVCVVLAMYPLCKWYDGLRSRSRSRWASYL